VTRIWRILATNVAAVLCAAAAAHGEAIVLENGDTLNGVILERTDDGVVLVHEVLGHLEIPNHRIRVEPPPAPPRGAFGTPLLVGWDRTFEFGLLGESGNSSTLNINTGLHLGTENEERRWLFDALYLRVDADRETTTNRSSAQLTRDWLFPGSPWFAFGRAMYERDSFEEWNHRYSVGGGPGYQFLDNERWNVRGRSGLQFTRTSGSGSQHDLVPEWLIGLEVLWKFAEGHSLHFYNTLFPSLEEVGDYRALTGLSWEAALEGTEAWKIKLGFQNEYDSTSRSPAEKDDLRYFANLLYDF
jgi:putative salt-induced outer membrane protein YdiY